MLRVLAAVLLLSLGACATPPPPKPAMVPVGTAGDFGYSSKDLAPDQIEVTYRGDAVRVSASNPRDDSRTKSEEDKAHDLALWRAAQIADERGQAGLKVENEKRDSDVEVQRRSYLRPSPFYDPYWGGFYDDPFWPRHGFYRRSFFYDDDWPYSYQQMQTATARAEIQLTVHLYPEYDPKIEGMLSTAETLSKLKAARSGAVY